MDIDSDFEELTRRLREKETAAPAPQTLKEAFQQVGAEWSKSIDRVAEEHGITRETAIVEIGSGLFYALMFGHHVRKGHVTKTIYWGVTLLGVGASRRGRAQRELLKKLLDK